MKRVAITGVSGYVGDKVLVRLSEADSVESILGIDRKVPRHIVPGLKFCRQDVLDPLGDLFFDNRVDTAIHLAFVLRPTHDRSGTVEIDVGGAVNFLKACEKAGVRHIVYLSSHTVYGAHADNPVPLTEEAPLRPLRDFQYSWDKAESEKLFRDFAASHKDVTVTILRSCPVIGPCAGGSAVTAMLAPPAIVRVTGFDPQMQFVHEDDLAGLIAHVLERGHGGVFNVAGGGELRYGEVAKIFHKKSVALPGIVLRSILSITWRARLQSESPPGGLAFIKYPPVVSTAKLERELGFHFRYSSREALTSYAIAGKTT